MNEQKESKLLNVAHVLSSKRSRSLVFLVITVFLILLLNGLLPLIEGQAHYTVSVEEVTYGEYLEMKSEDSNYDLTYASKERINAYVKWVIESDPDMSPEESIAVEPPDYFKVKIYTQFFFQSEWWWTDAVISMVSAVFLFYAWFYFMITRAKDTVLDFVNGENRLRRLNKQYLDPATFEPWMEHDFNKPRKRAQHIRNVKLSLKLLENKTDFQTRKRFKKYFEKNEPEEGSTLLPAVYDGPLSKEDLKYISRKEELLTQLTPEYIEEYVLDTDVKHHKDIQPSFVYSGVNIIGVTADEYSNVRSDGQVVRSQLLARALMGVSVSISFASLLTMLAMDVVEQNVFWIVIHIIAKFLPLGIQIYFATDYTNWFMDKQLIPVLKLRENIGFRYLSDMKRRGIDTQVVMLEEIVLEDRVNGKKNKRKNG